MNIQKDLFGKEPKVGDIIVFNPPSYKGLTYGTCIDFNKNTGNPILENLNRQTGVYEGLNSKQGKYSPKTGFVIVKDI